MKQESSTKSDVENKVAFKCLPIRLYNPVALPLIYKWAIGAILVALGGGFLFAQGFSGSSVHPKYDFRGPPPLEISKAYALAIARLGGATNRFYCVTASCVEPSNHWSSGWTFGFSNTNGRIAHVRVLFNQEAYVEDRSIEPKKMTRSFFRPPCKRWVCAHQDYDRLIQRHPSLRPMDGA
jgi:hypothetical protein